MGKTEKIRENYIFRRLYRRGKSEVSPCVVLYWQKVRGRSTNRIGITATKKIGGAVSRNRARRVINESYRLLEPNLATGYDFVIVARQKACKVKMQTVSADLTRLLSKIGGIKTTAKTKDNP